MGNRYIKIGEESAFGTRGDGTSVTFAPISESIVPDKGWIREDTTENQQYTNVTEGYFITTGAINGLLKPEKELGWFMKWILGDYIAATDSTTLDTGIYQHTFQIGQDPAKSFYMDIGIETNLRRLTKCMIDELTLNILKKELCNYTATIFAGTEASGTISSPSNTTLNAFVGGASKIEFDSAGTTSWTNQTDVSAEIEAATIRMSRGLNYPEWYGVGSTSPARIEEGGRMELEMTIDGYFADTTWYDHFLAGDNFKAIITLTGDSTGSAVAGAENYKLTITFNKCKLITDSVFHLDRRERRVFNAPIIVMYHASDNFVLVNKVANYVDADQGSEDLSGNFSISA